ncbi:MAG: DUF4249 domain-containing protein [Muribaculaceae bacterium]|nr:DUF4249 domain-containing protein [Muribaculaceae bacterium]
MDILKKTIPIILPFLLTGCYETFDPKIDTKPVLCLSSMITAGSPIEVKVSRTWLFTDIEGSKDHSVDDAVLRIYANGSPVDAGYRPEQGDHIRIVASSARYGEAEAEVTVPIATRISGIEFKNKMESLWTMDTPGWGIDATIKFGINISMTLEDKGNTDNFYFLTDKTYCPSSPDEDEDNFYEDTKNSFRISLSSGNFESVDPVFYEQTGAFEEVMNYSSFNKFFSDRLLDRETNTLNFGFTPCYFEISGWNGDPDELECGWKITLQSISESYYNWLAYTWQTDGIVFGDFADMGLAEPIWGYSNVSTGAGVVAAKSSTTVEINIKDFLLETLETKAGDQ